jgi:hemerythrin
MTQADWSQNMTCGVPALDRAHERLFAELRQLAAAADEMFSDCLCRVIAIVEQDFGDEERLMDDIDFPAIGSHREQHARVLGGLHHAASRVMSGDIACGRDAVALLMQWLPVHVSTMDTALAVAIDIAATERLVPGASPFQD